MARREPSGWKLDGEGGLREALRGCTGGEDRRRHGTLGRRHTGAGCVQIWLGLLDKAGVSNKYCCSDQGFHKDYMRRRAISPFS